MSLPEAYALLGNPSPYVSRRTRGNVTTVAIRLKRGGRTRYLVTAERVPPNSTWRISDRWAVGRIGLAVDIIVRDILADEGGA